jgi:hypothetical protein
MFSQHQQTQQQRATGAALLLSLPQQQQGLAAAVAVQVQGVWLHPSGVAWEGHGACRCLAAECSLGLQVQLLCLRPLLLASATHMHLLLTTSSISIPAATAVMLRVVIPYLQQACRGCSQ